ncbi:MAG: hypothetical protein IKL73_02440 [Lachnospiraceae bacterium]|nr:hypothetical protein [Lachnospiraceae bacterium]
MNVNGIKNVTAEYSATTVEAKASVTTATVKNSDAVVYEASKKPTKAEREALVAKLKADAEERVASLRSLVESMMTKQGVAIGQADDMWKFLASGDFTVDAETKAKAQEAISEDGYWGVKQISQRIFEFAEALSGGDSETMEKMKDAFIKGFKEATKSWGKELPSISNDTYDAVMDKFDKWFEEN